MFGHGSEATRRSHARANTHTHTHAQTCFLARIRSAQQPRYDVVNTHTHIHTHTHAQAHTHTCTHTSSDHRYFTRQFQCKPRSASNATAYLRSATSGPGLPASSHGVFHLKSLEAVAVRPSFGRSATCPLPLALSRTPLHGCHSDWHMRHHLCRGKERAMHKECLNLNKAGGNKLTNIDQGKNIKVQTPLQEDPLVPSEISSSSAGPAAALADGGSLPSSAGVAASGGSREFTLVLSFSVYFHYQYCH